MEMYSKDDLLSLNQLDSPGLRNELNERLNPNDSRFTHAQFCEFRGALIRNPAVATATGLDDDYPGLFQKIQVYLNDAQKKDNLSQQAGIFRDYTTALTHLHDHHKEVNHDTSSNSNSNANDPDLVTGTILADCKYCLAWLYELGILKSGYICYNEKGWSLLALAIKANAKNVIENLIEHSGHEPGPLRLHRIFLDGSIGISILKFAISSTKLDDTYLWALLNWCDSFMELEDTRIVEELDALDQYKIGIIASIRLINKLNNFGTNILEDASGPQGRTIWHAATIHQNTVFLTWLKTSHPTGINNRDHQNRTPLMYAIAQGKQESVEWLCSELTNDQIICQGDGLEPLPCALDTTIESWNENCVDILKCIYRHPVYVRKSQDIQAITNHTRQMISSLVVQKNNLSSRLQDGTLTRVRRRARWKNVKDWARGKCQILIETASSDLFQSSAFRDCLAFARRSGVGVLQYALSYNVVARRRLRSDGGF